MEVSFNPRDNGACPMCRRIASCPVRAKLSGSVQLLRPTAGPLEVVIYTCPHFVEKT